MDAKHPDNTPPPADTDWVEVVPLPGERSPGGLPKGRARAWGLVLTARAIPHRVHRRGWRMQLLVRAADRERAEEELRAYERENRDWPPPPAWETGPPLIDNMTRVMALLLIFSFFHGFSFHELALPGGEPVPLREVGVLDVYKVKAGQWWRVVTALTLHADARHLAGNLLIGGLFIVKLCRVYGAGVGFLLLLLAGTLGNIANVLARPGPHLSLGSSTAVFGAVGLLAALALVFRRESLWRRWVLALGAGAGVLAMLGGAWGERTDYLAHLFGFGAGLALGLLPAFGLTRGRPPKRANGLAGLVALALLFGAWGLAISQ